MMIPQSDQFLLQQQWAEIGVRHHHGIAFPLSSIHSATSAGIGEVLDLIPLLSWLEKTGFSILQLLPINDSGNDPSPYMALSAYALHPIYISLNELPNISSLDAFQTLRPELGLLKAKDRLHYQEVLRMKMEILRTYTQKGDGAKILASQDFEKFLTKESDWLYPYALFRALKEKNGGKAWWHFSQYAKRPTDLHSVFSKDPDLHHEVLFWAFLQYILFQQWDIVRTTARQHGIKIMGDLPILVSKDSSDVWWNPELFSLDVSVGAPPDMYAEEGQVWGFPLYKWNRMKQENYTWFSQRLHVQEQLYDLYRIDHIVGLFRFWAIPSGKKAKDGNFIPELPSDWISHGKEHIQVLIKASNMLPIGEDLGVIPDEVRLSMHQFGIPGIKVLRWERNWKLPNTQSAPFLDPKRFSPESLVTVSTHDSSTLQGWWNEDPHLCRQFCQDMGLQWSQDFTREHQYHILELSHKASSLFHVNLLQEYLALVPDLSWNDPDFDRINIPGTLSDMNWTWKTRVPVEILIENQELLSFLQKLSQS